MNPINANAQPTMLAELRANCIAALAVLITVGIGAFAFVTILDLVKGAN